MITVKKPDGILLYKTMITKSPSPSSHAFDMITHTKLLGYIHLHITHWKQEQYTAGTQAFF